MRDHGVVQLDKTEALDGMLQCWKEEGSINLKGWEQQVICTTTRMTD